MKRLLTLDNHPARHLADAEQVIFSHADIADSIRIAFIIKDDDLIGLMKMK